MGLQFEKAAPSQVGISSRSIGEMIDMLIARDIPLHSLLILKDDKLVCEAYSKPYDAKEYHRMYSITKSFVALAIGMLSDEGKLKLTDHIVDYFPDKTDENAHPYINALTIEQMLTMRTPHAKTTYKLDGCVDYVGSFFTTEPTKYPGTSFAYDTSSTHVLCALVERMTGMKLLDYMRVKMLDDIGFSKEAYCLTDPQGFTMGGSGLMCTPMDILKVMYVIMNGGCYAGKQYISSEFLKKALTKHSDNYAISSSYEEMCGYGYQFWMTSHNGYVCYGMGGQLGLCIPDKNMIVVTTADTQGRQGGVGMLYDVFWNTVYQSLDEKTDNVGDEFYSREIPQISLKGQDFCGEYADIFKKNRIVFPDSPMGFKYFEIDEDKITYENISGVNTLYFDINNNKLTKFPYYNHRALVSGAFTAENTFLIYAQIIDEYVGKVFLSFSVNDGHVGVVLKKIEESFYKEFNLNTDAVLVSRV